MRCRRDPQGAPVAPLEALCAPGRGIRPAPASSDMIRRGLARALYWTAQRIDRVAAFVAGCVRWVARLVEFGP